MSKFITPEDYDASFHREFLDALTRNDDTLVEICEDRAVSEMRGYLSARYDTDTLFSAEGSARHPLVLMMALDITVFHLFCIHNPQNLSQVREDRYERAVEWLRQVAKCQINIDGAPPLPDTESRQGLPWKMRSNPKRRNRR